MGIHSHSLPGVMCLQQQQPVLPGSAPQWPQRAASGQQGLKSDPGFCSPISEPQLSPVSSGSGRPKQKGHQEPQTSGDTRLHSQTQGGECWLSKGAQQKPSWCCICIPGALLPPCCLVIPSFPTSSNRRPRNQQEVRPSERGEVGRRTSELLLQSQKPCRMGCSIQSPLGVLQVPSEGL